MGSDKQTACEPDGCATIGGQYSEEADGNCLLLSGIFGGDDRAVLLINTQIYPTLVDFRLNVLRKSQLGERMLRYWDQFHDEAVEIGRGDADLVTDMIWSLSYVSPFVRAMMGEQISAGALGETPESYYAGALRSGAVGSIRRVIERYKRSASPAFSDALDDFERELQNLEGLNPREAVVALRRAD